MRENRPSGDEVRSALEQLFSPGQFEVAEEVQVGDQRADYEAWVQFGRRRLRLFAAPFLSPSPQDLLRERSVLFFDLAGSPWLAAASQTWFRRCLHDLAAAFEAPASPGIDALLHQRPSTAYPGMDDDQFRQYAWSVMQGLLVMMREGRSSRAS